MKLIFPKIIYARLARPIVAKMISFCVIGVGNTVIDLAIFTFGYMVLALPLVLAWLSPSPAST
jgi:putative flippase GtrA